MATRQEVKVIMALDIGSKRTGVALANTLARIAAPYTTLSQSDDLPGQVAHLAAKEHVSILVIGLPRTLDGNTSQQTQEIGTVAQAIEERTKLPVHFMDEAVTSAKAEAELKARKKPYRKEDIDMLAATYILEDFLNVYPEICNA